MLPVSVRNTDVHNWVVPKTVVEKFSFSRLEMEKVNFLHSPCKIFCISVFNVGSCLASCLKVVSATFLLVCFVCLKESICETRKNAFYFTSKALLALEIINF